MDPSRFLLPSSAFRQVNDEWVELHELPVIATVVLLFLQSLELWRRRAGEPAAHEADR